MGLHSVEEVTLEPGQRATIALGWAIEFSATYVGRILSRSGLSSKFGITAATSGVIDSNYRGEWKAVMTNLGQESYTIQKGDKIAQAVFYPIAHVQTELVEELNETVRGTGGFGSTGR